MRISYKKVNWKYSLTYPYFHVFPKAPLKRLQGRPATINKTTGAKRERCVVWINKHGTLAINKGYSWDGPSGPTIDTEDSLRASLVHDALYQLIREGRLPLKARRWADKEFRRILKEDGMNLFRRWIWYFAVHYFAATTVK